AGCSRWARRGNPRQGDRIVTALCSRREARALFSARPDHVVATLLSREDLMQLSVRTFRVSAAAALFALGVAACGDDDGTDTPATPPAPAGLTATAASETSINVS